MTQEHLFSPVFSTKAAAREPHSLSKATSAQMCMRKSRGVNSANAQDDLAQPRELPQLPAHSACRGSPQGQAWGKMSQAEQGKARISGTTARASSKGKA